MALSTLVPWRNPSSAGWKVPDKLIDEIRSRERHGLIDIAKPPQFVPGMRVRVLQGPLQNQIGLLTVLRPHERVLVLLQLLGSQQRVELSKADIVAVPAS
jgi:transcription antitermination factor NusG